MAKDVRQTIERRLQIAAGHRVYGHENKCKNLHGHNYVIFLYARSRGTLPQVDQIGRVIDFSVLKNKIDPWLQDNWDHAFLYWTRDVFLKDLRYSEAFNQLKWYEADFNPTAEEMAKFLLKLGNDFLLDTDVELYKVRVEETENCAAEAEVR